jgi:hypothetical protein
MIMVKPVKKANETVGLKLPMRPAQKPRVRINVVMTRAGPV